jgi:hypothetical protein
MTGGDADGAAAAQPGPTTTPIPTPAAAPANNPPPRPTLTQLLHRAPPSILRSALAWGPGRQARSLPQPPAPPPPPPRPTSNAHACLLRRSLADRADAAARVRKAAGAGKVPSWLEKPADEIRFGVVGGFAPPPPAATDSNTLHLLVLIPHPPATPPRLKQPKPTSPSDYS